MASLKNDITWKCWEGFSFLQFLLFLHLCCSMAGGGAQLSCSQGRFDSQHWLHHRHGQLDKRGTGPRRRLAVILKPELHWAEQMPSTMSRTSSPCWGSTRGRSWSFTSTARTRRTAAWCSSPPTAAGAERAGRRMTLAHFRRLRLLWPPSV